MEKTYYSLGDKETLGQKVAKKKQSTVKRIETTPDFSASDVKSDEISAKDITSLVGLAVGSLLLTVLIYQNVHFAYDSSIDDGWWTRL